LKGTPITRKKFVYVVATSIRAANPVPPLRSFRRIEDQGSEDKNGATPRRLDHAALNRLRFRDKLNLTLPEFWAMAVFLE
jgi:hypothetical protein